MKAKLLIFIVSIFMMTSCAETGSAVYMSRYQKRVQRKFTNRQLSGDLASSRKVRIGKIGSLNDRTVTPATRKNLIQNKKRRSL